MTSSYAKCSSVLVIDPDLITVQITSLSSRILATTLLSSSWMARSWTLQEAALAVKLDFVYADAVVPFLEVDRGGMIANTSMLQSLWHIDVNLAGDDELFEAFGFRLGAGRFARVDDVTSILDPYLRPEEKFVTMWNELCKRNSTKIDDLAAIVAVFLGLSASEVSKACTQYSGLKRSFQWPYSTLDIYGRALRQTVAPRGPLRYEMHMETSSTPRRVVSLHNNREVNPYSRQTLQDRYESRFAKFEVVKIRTLSFRRHRAKCHSLAQHLHALTAGTHNPVEHCHDGRYCTQDTERRSMDRTRSVVLLVDYGCYPGTNLVTHMRKKILDGLIRKHLQGLRAESFRSTADARSHAIARPSVFLLRSIHWVKVIALAATSIFAMTWDSDTCSGIAILGCAFFIPITSLYGTSPSMPLLLQLAKPLIAGLTIELLIRFLAITCFRPWNSPKLPEAGPLENMTGIVDKLRSARYKWARIVLVSIRAPFYAGILITLGWCLVWVKRFLFSGPLDWVVTIVATVACILFAFIFAIVSCAPTLPMALMFEWAGVGDPMFSRVRRLYDDF
ncbi:hypothetical protein CC86DRAFT_385093 [Ophiobolus disseminans]|uniref:Heterokaryon incompatibility domain-containing protein n=1 Tax=Ophiobolus disseminans TaxID=1469910 RepID=A0A6A6ZQL3_9PLEO|nr:hypothetical protein CC86DRAFT_385093 [Ophiobolus disseminans]